MLSPIRQFTLQAERRMRAGVAALVAGEVARQECERLGRREARR